MHPDHDTILAATQTWLTRAVIGLNLCPFAKAVHVKNQIRYKISQARTPEALLEDLITELNLLRDTDPEEVDTTLLVHPDVLGDFMDYNDFHPDYQFSGTEPDDIDNFSNRSPYPTLHLIRESSIEQAVQAFPDASDIYETNIQTLRKLGHEGWQKLWQLGSDKA